MSASTITWRGRVERAASRARSWTRPRRDVSTFSDSWRRRTRRPPWTFASLPDVMRAVDRRATRTRARSFTMQAGSIRFGTDIRGAFAADVATAADGSRSTSRRRAWSDIPTPREHRCRVRGLLRAPRGRCRARRRTGGHGQRRCARGSSPGSRPARYESVKHVATRTLVPLCRLKASNECMEISHILVQSARFRQSYVGPCRVVNVHSIATTIASSV